MYGLRLVGCSHYIIKEGGVGLNIVKLIGWVWTIGVTFLLIFFGWCIWNEVTIPNFILTFSLGWVLAENLVGGVKMINA